MSDLIELKKVSIDFRRLSSNLLGTECDTADINFCRFKEYIDKTSIIVEILQEKMSGKQVDFKDYFPISSSGYCNIKIPKDEAEHIKAIYDLIDYIILNDIKLYSLAFTYYCSSRKIVDMIQNFLCITVKPLIDYIRDEISKKMILEEEKNMPGVNITGNENSTISIAYRGNQTITSNISVNKADIFDTIENIKRELKKVEIGDEERENLEDDLDVIKEQVENSVKKPTRLKKAYSNIKDFFEKSSTIIAKAGTLGLGIEKLIELLSSIISKI